MPYSFGNELDTNDNYFFDENLIGLWHLNNDANDYSSNDNNGFWNGNETYSNGLWDTNAGFFDTMNYVNIGNNSILNSINQTNKATVSAWVKTTSSSEMLIYGGSDASSPYAGIQLGIGVSKSYQYLTMWVRNNTGGFPDWIGGTIKLDDGKWHHVVGVVDEGNYYLYVDGILDVNGSCQDIGTYTGNKAIGAIGGSGGLRFNGEIEEVALWNRDLNAQEIFDLYRKGVSKLDLNFYTCSDSNCETKTENVFITKTKNNYDYNLTSLKNSKYAGFDISFGVVDELSSYTNAEVYGKNLALFNDINIEYSLVDNVAPIVSVDNNGEWFNNDFNLMFNVDFGSSGFAIAQYNLDLNGWQNFDYNTLTDFNVPIITDGNHSIDYNFVDGAGNISSGRIFVLRDTNAPTITLTSSSITQTTATITATLNQDANCRISTTDTNYDSASQDQYDSSILWNLTSLNEGTNYTYYVWCKDKANNDSNSNISFTTTTSTTFVPRTIITGGIRPKSKIDENKEIDNNNYNHSINPPKKEETIKDTNKIIDENNNVVIPEQDFDITPVLGGIIIIVIIISGFVLLKFFKII